MTKSVVSLLALLLLGSHAFAQPKAMVHLKAFPLSAFTKLAIDTVTIQVSHSLATPLPHPTRFLRQLTRVLRHTDTVAASRFRHDFVRFAFRLTYPDGRQADAFVSKGSYLLLDQRVYPLGNPVRRVLRRNLPERNDYLPLLTPRMRRIARDRTPTTGT